MHTATSTLSSKEKGSRAPIDTQSVHQLAVQIYERNLGIYRSIEYQGVKVASVNEIPDGERKIVEVEGVSIGVFHHHGAWYALRNSCLHRGGPVCTGVLKDDVITCPWHGYQYYVTSGELLLDKSAHLEKYPVEIRDGDIYLTFPTKVMDAEMVQLDVSGDGMAALATPVETTSEAQELKMNEFRTQDLKPGHARQVYVGEMRGGFQCGWELLCHSERMYPCWRAA